MRTTRMTPSSMRNAATRHTAEMSSSKRFDSLYARSRSPGCGSGTITSLITSSGRITDRR